MQISSAAGRPVARPRAVISLVAALTAGALWLVCGIVNWLLVTVRSSVHHAVIDLLVPATFARADVLGPAGIAVEAATTVFVALAVGTAAWWCLRGMHGAGGPVAGGSGAGGPGAGRPGTDQAGARDPRAAADAGAAPGAAYPRTPLFCTMWLAAVLAGTFAATGAALGAFAQSAPHAFVAGGAGWVWPLVVSAAHWGAVTGWIPALAFLLLLRRAGRTGTADAGAPGAARPLPADAGAGDGGTGADDARVAALTRRAARRRMRGGAISAAVVMLVALCGVALVSYGAESAAWATSHGNEPGISAPEASTPTATATAPIRDATPAPTSPAIQDRCAVEDSLITMGQVQGALGRRILDLYLTNTGAHECLVEGFPGIAFTDAGGAAVAIEVTADAAGGTAERITLHPGDMVRARLSWRAGQGTGSGQVATGLAVSEAAPATPATSARFTVDLGLDADSSVRVSPWSTLPRG